MYLFSELYVATQVHMVDMEDFFRHETLSYPPSLSLSGSTCRGQKSDILTHLKGLVMTVVDTEPVHRMPRVDGVVIDGCVIVNQIKPNKKRTFMEYAEEKILPFLMKYKAWLGKNAQM